MPRRSLQVHPSVMDIDEHKELVSLDVLLQNVYYRKFSQRVHICDPELCSLPHDFDPLN